MTSQRNIPFVLHFLLPMILSTSFGFCNLQAGDDENCDEFNFIFIPIFP